MLCFNVIDVNAQLTEGEVPTNLTHYLFAPHPLKDVVKAKSIHKMEFYSVREDELESFLNDTTKVFDQKGHDLVMSATFNSQGLVAEINSELLSESRYVYTYDANGKLITLENYREGQKHAQNKEAYLYDKAGFILQRKIVWKDFYTGGVDQVSYFNYTWTADHAIENVTYKRTLDRGKPTAGKIEDKYLMKRNENGLDTVWQHESYSFDDKTWKMTRYNITWKRNEKFATERIKTGKEFNEVTRWEYDEAGRLIRYTEEGNVKTQKVKNGRKYFYDLNGNLRGYYHELMRRYMLIQYTYR